MEHETSHYDILNYQPDGILIVDGRGVILFANEAFLNIVGYKSELLVGLNIMSLLADIGVFQECITEVMEEGFSKNVNTDFLHHDGHIVQTVKSVRMIQEADQTRMFVNVHDLSEINLLNKELRQSKELMEHQAHELSALLNSKHQELEEILGSIEEVIWYIDSQTLSLLYVNDAVEGMFGFSRETFLSDDTLWQQQIYPDDRALVKMFFETLSPGKSQEIRFRILRSDGEIRWINSRIHHHPKLHFFIGVTSDITSSKEQGERITYLAYHDPLTSLPNRARLKERLEGRFRHSPDAPFALLFLDLDNFKNINDTMGHETGDRILVEVSRRLQNVIGKDDFCARFGGDEFVLKHHNANAEQIDAFCRKLIDTFKNPFKVNEIDFFLSASIGIVLYPHDACTGEDLIKFADTAMYEAKKKGKNQFVYYNASMQNTINNFLHIESLIREGLQEHFFELYFQPLIESKTLRVEGYEALLRLRHPREGFISPEHFIPVAETNGDILRLGKVVLSQACDFIETLRSVDSNPFFIAVNISAKQLQQDSFATELLDYLAQRAIPSSFLKIELTESAVMENIETATKQLQQLKNGGIRVALDDFGTGYSSFAYLAQLPIDTLKIDKSFILTLFEINNHRHIVEAMANLAHVLGMSVTAEGVEENAHFEYLVDSRIDTLQGYHLCRPLPRDEIIHRLKEHSDDFTPAESLGYTI